MFVQECLNVQGSSKNWKKNHGSIRNEKKKVQVTKKIIWQGSENQWPTLNLQGSGRKVIWIYKIKKLITWNLEGWGQKSWK